MDVLDRAGVLGAVLALIAREAHSVRKKRPLSKASADCLQVYYVGICTVAECSPRPNMVPLNLLLREEYSDND